MYIISSLASKNLGAKDPNEKESCCNLQRVALYVDLIASSLIILGMALALLTTRNVNLGPLNAISVLNFYQPQFVMSIAAGIIVIDVLLVLIQTKITKLLKEIHDKIEPKKSENGAEEACESEHLEQMKQLQNQIQDLTQKLGDANREKKRIQESAAQLEKQMEILNQQTAKKLQEAEQLMETQIEILNQQTAKKLEESINRLENECDALFEKYSVETWNRATEATWQQIEKHYTLIPKDQAALGH